MNQGLLFVFFNTLLATETETGSTNHAQSML